MKRTRRRPLKTKWLVMPIVLTMFLSVLGIAIAVEPDDQSIWIVVLCTTYFVSVFMLYQMLGDEA